MSILRLLTPSGADLAKFCDRLSVAMTWGGRLTWSGSFTHHTSGLLTMPSPLIPPGSGAFVDEILPHDFAGSRYLDLTVAHAGETVRFPRLLPSDPSFDGGRLDWSGTDQTPLLERDGEPMDDILFDGGGVKRTASQAMAEIGTEYGIDIRYQGTDFDIRELRRGSGGTAWGWLTQIAEVYQCAPRWEGANTLIFEPAAFDPDASSFDWQFVDRQTIETGQIQSNADDVRNVLTVARLEPQSRILGEQICRSPQVCSGRTGRITLSAPSKSIHVIGETDNGRLENFTAFDADDRVTAFRAVPGPMVGTRPIVRLEYTFRHVPRADLQPLALGYRVVVYGGAQPTDQTYSWTVSSAQSIAEIGERKEIRAIESALVARASVGAGMAAAVLDERIRRTWSLPMSSPFANPLIRPGHRVQIVDWLTGGSRIWFVQEVRWDWTSGATDRLQITGVRPWLT